jgi:hypothetical protein
MHTLMDETRGAFLVRSQSSEYVISLDLNVVRRLPYAFVHEVASLRRDGQQMDLLQILECTVGREMLVLVDMHLPDVPFTARRSTTVVAIRKLTDEEEAERL